MVASATVNKDFKVKNGLIVNGGGEFGGAVVVATPTLSTHAATKEYVDSLVSGMQVGATAPSTPNNGDLWFDTVTERVNVYYSGSWLTVANVEDTLNLPDHIHDTSIDGNGLIVLTLLMLVHHMILKHLDRMLGIQIVPLGAYYMMVE